MSKQSHCQVTVKDFTILEVLLERTPLYDEAFRRLLRRKLSTATVVFHDDVDPQVATLNSRVEYAVDDGPTDNRILVHGDERALPGLTLPITTLRGLALLGLRVDDSIVIERPDGAREEVRLRWVAYQPEAARRKVPMQPSLPGLAPAPDDDPGPRAA